MKFIIKGDPISKKRHRHRGKFTYDPQDREKKAVQAELMFQVTQATKSENKSILEQINAICTAPFFKVNVEFHCTPAQSDLWGLRKCCNRADIDNYQKFILDCCNGILFSDDHKVVEIHAKKLYNPYPKSIMLIEPMTEVTPFSNDQKQFLKMFSPEELSSFLEDVSVFQEFSSIDLEVLSENEWDAWINEISLKKIKFAHKWGLKLKKLADKTTGLNT